MCLFPTNRWWMAEFGSELFTWHLCLAVCLLKAFLMWKRHFVFPILASDDIFWKITITFCQISVKNNYSFLDFQIRAYLLTLQDMIGHS